LAIGGVGGRYAEKRDILKKRWEALVEDRTRGDPSGDDVRLWANEVGAILDHAFVRNW
jgi:hypothetical protein